MKIVIVESPAKCKKIEEYLGPGYRCIASYGHLRILNDLGQINVAAGYTVKYRPDPTVKKRKHAEFMQGLITAATNEVILATDDDREGEAIAWHICDMFGLPVATTPRIVFHEITKPAVQAAIAAPRRIDMHMVHAQQARQIIDLLVGFKITPVLWRCLVANKENPLSAGRCQTPALRLVFENDRQIRNTVLDSAATYKVVAEFGGDDTSADGAQGGSRHYNAIPFELYTNTDTPMTEPTPFLTASATHQHLFMGCTAPRQGTRAPPLPLTTSRLQQAANNELHWDVKSTMQVAQTLYEGGHITYMRTDSATYSPIFIAAAIKYITAKWGSNFVGNKVHGNSTTNKAHEAIRPTVPTLTPTSARTKMNERQLRLYTLIWEHTMGSLMSPAITETITATVSAPPAVAGVAAIYKHTSEQTIFLGWLVAKRGCNEDEQCPHGGIPPPPEWHILQKITKGMPIRYNKITATPTFKSPPHHYTEAHLVKLLEEMGIGRPSTFASLVDKIQEREYVEKDDVKAKKIQCVSYCLTGVGNHHNITPTTLIVPVGGEKNKLLLRPIGRIVSDFLDAHFNPVLNYEYTSQMETALDQIATGERALADVCKECDDGIAAQLAAVKATAVKKVAHRFPNGMEFVIGRQGPVIHASLPVSHFIPLPAPYCDICDLEFIERIQRGEIGLADLVGGETATMAVTTSVSKTVPSIVPMGEWNGKQLFIKTGKFGPYVAAVTVPVPVPSVDENKPKKRKTKAAAAAAADDITKSLNILGVRPIDEYTREEVVAVLEGTAKNIKVLRTFGNIGADVLSVRRGGTSAVSSRSADETQGGQRRGNKEGSVYIYFKTAEMKKPAFYKFKGFLEDPLECDEATLFQWITKKHENIAAAVGA